jgi:hypothetical protein
MSESSEMILSQLDKQTLRHIVTLLLKHTGIRVRESSFRYTVEDVRRQLTFGGDFSYGFGEFFKLVSSSPEYNLTPRPVFGGWVNCNRHFLPVMWSLRQENEEKKPYL